MVFASPNSGADMYDPEAVRAGSDDEGADPLDDAHDVLRDHFITKKGPILSLNEYFRRLDSDVLRCNLKTFAKMLYGAGLEGKISSQEINALFEYYDVERRGFNEFLVGLRYVLGTQTSETEYICDKIRSRLSRLYKVSTDIESVRSVLEKNGLAAHTEVDETEFLGIMQSMLRNTCTHSELSFLFSLFTSSDRRGTTTGLEVMEVIASEPSENLVGSTRGTLLTENLDLHEMIRALGASLYSSKSTIKGLVALTRHMKWYDQNTDGNLERSEFVASLASVGGLSDKDLQTLFRLLDTDHAGQINVNKFLKHFNIGDYIEDSAAMKESVHVVCRAIQRKGYESVYRSFEKYDLAKNGQLDLHQFTHALHQLCGSSMSDLDIEWVFSSYKNTPTTLTWSTFLHEVTGRGLDKDASASASRSAAENRTFAPKVSSKRVDEIHEAIALALGDERGPDPQAIVQDLRKIFKKYDVHQSGCLSIWDFKTALQEVPTHFRLKENDIEMLFGMYDPEGTGRVPYHEVIVGLRKSPCMMDMSSAGVDLDDPSSPKGKKRTGPKKKLEAKPERMRLPPPGCNATADEKVQYERLHNKVSATMKVSSARGLSGAPKYLQGYDGNKDGRLERREFIEALKGLGLSFTTKQMDVLFGGYDRNNDGTLEIEDFVDGMRYWCKDRGGGEAYDFADENVILEAPPVDPRLLARMNQALKGLKKFSNEHNVKTFNSYDQRHRGALNQRGYMALMEEVATPGILSSSDLEEVFRDLTRDSSEFTFEDFNICIRGFGRESNRTINELLDLIVNECYHDLKPNRTQGNLDMLKIFDRYDRNERGALDAEEFSDALGSLGLGISPKEIRTLYKSYAGRQGVDMKEFLRVLRGKYHYKPSDKEFNRLMKTISDGFVDHGYPLNRMDRLRLPLEWADFEHTGQLDLAEFTGVIHGLTGHQLLDYEIEVVFNHFAVEGLEFLEYDDFVEAIHTGQAYLKDDDQHHTYKSPAPKPPPSKAKIMTAELRLLPYLYDLDSHYAGSVDLAKILTHYDRNADGLVDKDQFMEALLRYDLVKASVSTKELSDVFDHYSIDDTGKVSIEEFVNTARTQQPMELTVRHYNEILGRLREHVHDKVGNCTEERLRVLFDKYQSAETGRMTLSEFTRTIASFDNKGLKPIEIELLYNVFVPERVGEIDIAHFVSVLHVQRIPKQITDPEGILMNMNRGKNSVNKDSLHPTPQLTDAELERHLQALARSLYSRFNMGQRQAGAKDIYIAMQNFDYDNDGFLREKDFMRALARYNLCGFDQPMLAAIFEKMMDPRSRLLNIRHFLQAVKERQEGMIQSDRDLDVILGRLKKAITNRGNTGGVTVLRVFANYDWNGNGLLSYAEFEKAIRDLLGPTEKPLSQADIDLLFTSCDINHTGEIDFREFFHQVGWITKDEEASPRGKQSPIGKAPAGARVKVDKKGIGLALPSKEDLDGYTPDHAKSIKNKIHKEYMESYLHRREGADAHVLCAVAEGKSIITPFGQIGAYEGAQPFVSPTSSTPKHTAWEGEDDVAVQKFKDTYAQITHNESAASKASMASASKASMASTSYRTNPSNASVASMASSGAASTTQYGQYGNLPEDNGEVEEFLQSLGLEQYLPAFEYNEVGIDELPDLTDDDLRDMGVPLGARKKIRAALAKF